jgi:hypothetical protein
VRGWDQAQQQHRMTPQHMESMRMAVTAVVEDMPPVEHDGAGPVHGVGVASRRTDVTPTAQRGPGVGKRDSCLEVAKVRCPMMTWPAT